MASVDVRIEFGIGVNACCPICREHVNVWWLRYNEKEQELYVQVEACPHCYKFRDPDEED